MMTQARFAVVLLSWNHDFAMTPDVILNLPDDDDGTRSTKVLAAVLQLAKTIWENEDKSLERRPDYDVEVTVRAAVELSGAVQDLDMLMRGGYPLPEQWLGDRPPEQLGGGTD